MPLKLYNTLSRKKKIFEPRIDRKVQMFVCGPTVYDYSHIGHARTYIAFDMIARYLRSIGYDVFYLQNITDLDDKILIRAKKEKMNPLKLSKQFADIYFKDMKSLDIGSVSKYAFATKYIEAIVKQVKALIKKGYAYEIERDGIYYDLKKFKDYGKLSHRTVKQAEDALTRIDESIKKRNKGDFCLWKFAKPKEPKWKSPWGYGRPGWHIEDTAITETHFGSQYDIHGGARDLIFPHHDSEIAQMEAISGKKPMVKYWLHVGFLNVQGKKMSKSLGNFITIRDLLKKYNSEVFRLFIISTHYRSPINFSYPLLDQSKKSLERVYEFVDKIKSNKKEVSARLNSKLVTLAKKEFARYMEDDFDTPRALGSIFNLIRKTNKLIDRNKLSAKEKKQIYSFLLEVDRIFGLGLKKKKKETVDNKQIKKLVQEREQARLAKNWTKADEIRKKLKKMDVEIRDTDKGPKVKYKR